LYDLLATPVLSAELIAVEVDIVVDERTLRARALPLPITVPIPGPMSLGLKPMFIAESNSAPLPLVPYFLLQTAIA
jgi:hypothetical protein